MMAAMIAIASAGQLETMGSDRFSMPPMVFLCSENSPFFMGMGGTERDNFLSFGPVLGAGTGWPDHRIYLNDALHLRIGERDEHMAVALFGISARAESADYDGIVTVTMPNDRTWKAAVQLNEAGKSHSFECDLTLLPESKKQ